MCFRSVFYNLYEWFMSKYENVEHVLQPTYEYIQDEYKSLDTIMSRVVRDQLFDDE
jgi:hypothetical protein